MSRLLWFLIGSAATLVAGAVAANYMNDEEVDRQKNELPDEVDDREIFDKP